MKESLFETFIKESIQDMSECMDEPVQLTDEELNFVYREVSNDGSVWDAFNMSVLESIDEAIANRKTDLQERKEDEAKDERYQ